MVVAVVGGVGGVAGEHLVAGPNITQGKDRKERTHGEIRSHVRANAPAPNLGKIKSAFSSDE